MFNNVKSKDPCDYCVTPVPIGLGFGTALGLGFGLRGPDLGLGLDNSRDKSFVHLINSRQNNLIASF